MKAVILAGGLGSRLSEETVLKPKPMVEIGGRPILWHIMKIYASHGINDFVICSGYKGYVIKEWFANYSLHVSDVSIEMASGKVSLHNNRAEPWRVTIVDTGDGTMTGGRLKRITEHVIGEDAFCMTYGDGVSDIDITGSIAFHRAHGRRCTVAAVQPPGRFGSFNLDGVKVTSFVEKPIGDGSWINGGFFVLAPDVLNLIRDDSTIWEQEPMRTLATQGDMLAYKHQGFWQPMDTLRDKLHLEDLWQKGGAPWKCW